MAEPVEILQLVGQFNDRVVVDMEVPAFTVDTETLRERVSELMETYLLRSELNELSLADFALFLLSQAATDPKEQ